MFAGTAGNSTSISVTPSSIAATTEFVASLTSSAYDSGLYVILPADLDSLAACGSAVHAVVCLCLLRLAALVKGLNDLDDLICVTVLLAPWMREPSSCRDCILSLLCEGEKARSQFEGWLQLTAQQTLTHN
jgi:hypothetical protein